MQIRTRLTLQFVLIAASIMALAMGFVYWQFKTHLQDEFFGNLRSKGNLTAEMAVGKSDKGNPFLPRNSDAEEILLTSYTENVSIYNQHLQRVYSFHPAPNDIQKGTLKEIAKSGECRFMHGKFSALGGKFTNRAGQQFVVVTEGIFNSQYLSDLAKILWAVSLVFTALAAVSGWFFAGQALAPVNRIMNQVDAILPSDLSRRLEMHNQHDELSRLVATFNQLLDRLQRAFQAQKMFLSNLSHELKNPFTVIIAQLEIMLDKERTREEYRQTLVSILDDVKELNEVSEKLMQLARINNDGLEVAFEQVRIDEMIWQAKAALLKTHPEYRISFEVVNLPEEESKLFVTGNEQLLRTALLNLMDNGCKYSPDKKVKIKLSFNPEGVSSIEIIDQGPGIAAEELPLVFEPFYRSPKTASVKGSGVGLSLVDSIMKLHKIDLRVSSKQGSGTAFKLEFPQEN